VRPSIALAVLSLLPLAAGWSRRAEACPPSVRLEGERARVAEVAAILAARGVTTASEEGCPALAVTLEAKGRATLVSASGEDAPLARTVTDARTAATVVESWVRTDVEAPLLPRRAADDDEPRADVEAPPSLVLAASPPAGAAVELTTFAVTSFGSDRTSWLGAEIGACARRGRACVGARLRAATVADGPGDWEGELDREAVDALATLDVPLTWRRARVSPGVGLGVGWTHTHEESGIEAAQTLGLRAEARLVLAYPVSRGVSACALAALGLGQTLVTGESERFPGDPRLMGHVGFGVRLDGP